jgi:spore maturation protein CgeB
MKFVLFCHSISSDWNNGNAHFQRGVAAELAARGHTVVVYEPRDGWSRRELERAQGAGAVAAQAHTHRGVRLVRYDLAALDLDAALDGASVAIAHEWNPPELIEALGRRRASRGGFRLLFHDTHHRAVSSRESIARFQLAHFDGVLAFGRVVCELYERAGWSSRTWVWHEAADTRLFGPRPGIERRRDLVWIGNGGDGEREREYRTFLLEPACAAGCSGCVHGVRYSRETLRAIADSPLRYRGWIANHATPEVYARHRVTVHIPRRPYAEALPGIPTIRMFEALACGIPLISAPWDDAEQLFRPGRDYLRVGGGPQMRAALAELLADPDRAQELARSGRETVLARHTCAHRVDELLRIVHEELALDPPSGARRAAAR